MDTDQINGIFKKNMSMVYGYLRKLGVTHSDAEDIVQDTLYKALVHIELIDPDKFRAWLYKVAINNYYDLCRKRKKHQHLPLDSLNLKDSLTPEDYSLNREKEATVLRVYSELKPVYKHLLYLKYQAGLTYKEIAEVLNINIETVKKYLYRGRKRFEEEYRRLSDD